MDKVFGNKKKRVVVRNSEKINTKLGVFLYGLFRFLVYGMVGVFGEVSLYTIIKVGKTIPFLAWAFKFQWRVDDTLNLNGIWNIDTLTLFGQCSLWMFLVYATCAFFVIEYIYRHNYYRPWVLRGIMYAFAILIFEFVSGYLLWWGTGYKIWYYADSFLYMTSLYTLPLWFVTGMIVEVLYRELKDKDLKESIEKELEEINKKAGVS